MLLDFIGTAALTAVIVVNLVAVLGSLRLPASTRIVLAVIVGLWIGLQAALSGAGVYAQDIPYIGLGVVVPLVAAAVAVGRLPPFREALLSLPTPLLVGLNISRVFGGFSSCLR